MPLRRRIRSLVALTAAYAVALQAIFSAALLADHSARAASLTSAVICQGQASKTDGGPAGETPCCPCAVFCNSPAVEGGLIPAAGVLPAFAIGQPAAFSSFDAFVAIATGPGLHAPRAPPAA